MTTTILAATDRGRRTADHLAATLTDVTVGDSAPLREAVAAAWPQSDALVLCSATGVAVRLIAPLLQDKHLDPAVVVVDDARRFVIALAGGHHGANDLARRVADALGAIPVVTTASDALDLPALDRLGASTGLTIDPDVSDTAAVGAALIDGEPVHRWRSCPWPTGPLPGNVTEVDVPQPPLIAITDEIVEVPRPAVLYRPSSLVVGVGASRGVDAGEVGGLIDTALADAGLSPRSVAHVATVDAKSDEAGLLTAAAARGWAVITHPADRLADVAVPNPSDVVAAAVGTPSVAEAAALAEGGTLVVAKRKTANATVAIARRPVRGRLLLVSTGPGEESLVPDMARQALGDAEVVVGLDQYVQRIRRWLRPGTDVRASPIGDEVRRAEQAVAAARAGRVVALLSGGDIGVYAMGSPALEQLADDTGVDVVTIPGVTAAVAAAALLGSPLGHDHCAISLSDLLTPWEVIRRRVKAAAEGDFVVTFYNPRSRGRDWQLHEARMLLLEHRKPATPVGVVTDAYRPTQRVAITTLGDLDVEQVDMLTTVVVGNSQTRIDGGRIVTPRGYA